MKSKIISDSQSDELRILILEDVAEDAELMEQELRQGGIAFSSKRVDTDDSRAGNSSKNTGRIC